MFILELLTYFPLSLKKTWIPHLINGYIIAQAQYLKPSQFLFFLSPFRTNLSDSVYSNSEILEFISFSLSTLPPFCFLGSYHLPPNKTSHGNQNSYLKKKNLSFFP